MQPLQVVNGNAAAVAGASEGRKAPVISGDVRVAERHLEAQNEELKTRLRVAAEAAAAAARQADAEERAIVEKVANKENEIRGLEQELDDAVEALEERRSEVDVAVASLADEEAEVNAKASAAARALERNGLNAVTGEPLAPPSEEASTTAGEAMARYQAKLAALRSRIDHQKGKLEEHINRIAADEFLTHGPNADFGGVSPDEIFGDGAERVSVTDLTARIN